MALLENIRGVGSVVGVFVDDQPRRGRSPASAWARPASSSANDEVVNGDVVQDAGIAAGAIIVVPNDRQRVRARRDIRHAVIGRGCGERQFKANVR